MQTWWRIGGTYILLSYFNWEIAHQIIFLKNVTGRFTSPIIPDIIFHFLFLNAKQKGLRDFTRYSKYTGVFISLICTAIYHALSEVISAQGRWPAPAQAFSPHALASLLSIWVIFLPSKLYTDSQKMFIIGKLRPGTKELILITGTCYWLLYMLK